MADLTVTTANVRPANAHQCIIRNFESGAAIDVGEIVFIDPADNLAKLADASAAGTMPGIGVVVAIGAQGQTTGLAAGEMLSVVLFGPVVGFAVDAGDLSYVSDTAGALADAAGTVSQVFGIGLEDGLLMVNPQL